MEMMSNMAIKKTSATIAIGFRSLESAPGVMNETEVELGISPLNREVFCVQAVDLEVGLPDFVIGVDSNVQASVTTVSQTAIQHLNNEDCFAIGANSIRTGNSVDSGVSFVRHQSDGPQGDIDLIAIIPTTSFFVQCEGTNNNVAKATDGKLYGYRATADANTYMALVAGMVLTA